MIHVTSEIGRLRRVLVHQPGREVDVMVPSLMDSLLFDDIVYGDNTRIEHKRFTQVLQLMDVEVLDMNDLVAESLDRPGAREWIAGALERGGAPLPSSHVMETPAPELALDLVGGVRRSGDHGVADVDEMFLLPPVFNWAFQRDPQFVVHDGVVLSSMATPTRWREPFLTRLVFTFHESFTDTRLLHDPHAEGSAGFAPGGPTLEGGDCMVLSPDVVAVGLSERSNREGIEGLTRALTRIEGGPRWLLVVQLPGRRAYMHLDTVFTQIDRDAALAFPPVILEDGPEAARVAVVDLHAADPRPESVDGAVIEVLRKKGIDLEGIPCGGDDIISQQREQWTDGANALAVAPGVIFLYRRNVRTAEVLAERGYDVVTAEDLLLGRAEGLDLGAERKLCVLITCNEISRARGGPHCLSHGLLRDDP